MRHMMPGPGGVHVESSLCSQCETSLQNCVLVPL